MMIVHTLIFQLIVTSMERNNDNANDKTIFNDPANERSDVTENAPKDANMDSQIPTSTRKQQDTTPQISPAAKKTRVGRTIKKPLHFKDFIDKCKYTIMMDNNINH